MDEFERWFLVVYTIYVVLALLALLWVGARPPQPRGGWAARPQIDRVGDRR
jgi:hypothetical protein